MTDMDENMREEKRGRADALEGPVRHLLIGQTYLLVGRYDSAIKAYETSLKMRPGNAKACLFLGNAWYKKACNSPELTRSERKDCLDRALASYGKVLELSPDNIIGDRARTRITEVGADMER